MDLNGVYASLNFPSSLAGFAGQRYQLGVSDPSSRSRSCAPPTTGTSTSGRARTRRIIPCQVPWLLDPDVAAAEVRANARAGSGR